MWAQCDNESSAKWPRTARKSRQWMSKSPQRPRPKPTGKVSYAKCLSRIKAVLFVCLPPTHSRCHEDARRTMEGVNGSGCHQSRPDDALLICSAYPWSRNTPLVHKERECGSPKFEIIGWSLTTVLCFKSEWRKEDDVAAESGAHPRMYSNHRWINDDYSGLSPKVFH